MASHEAYLRGALGKYQYPDIAKRDILNAFRSYTDLRPKLDAFVFNDGSRKELLCLEGTIPVKYKGTTYNIPLCLWLMDTHPYNPPMVFVRPTANMQIKQGKHVDANGKIYLPYLHEWKHPQSDLLGLIQILVIIFGEEPPVFARSAANRGQQPPYQAVGGGTPYPAAAGNVGMPMPSVGFPSTGGYPPASTGSYPYPPSYPASSTGYPPASNVHSYPPSYAGYPPATTASATQSHASHTPVSSQNSLSLSDEQIRASLLSAVEDKMRRRLKEIFAQAQAEMEALNRTSEDLQRGKQTLDDMMQKLETEQNDVEKNMVLLQQKNEEIKEVLNKMENKEEIGVDDAVVPTTPLYKQLLNAFAEEQATEDTIYHLQEGLKRGVIDLEVFLKQVRELSRKQFMCRALMTRCRQKAGLPDLTVT